MSHKKVFEGLTVLDFSANVAGPITSAFLADFGADVIKVERPKTGDDLRHFAPLSNGSSLIFEYPNRGKRSLAIALDDPEGVEIIKKLIVKADVIVENFKPGTMKKFGLGYEDVIKITPNVVYCSISSFGAEGTLSQVPGYDLTSQALSGFMDMTGDPDGSPMRAGYVLGDYTAAYNAYAAIATALYHRERTGEGQFIDIAILDCMIAGNGMLEATANGFPVTRTGNHHKSLAPFGVFNGKNRQSVIITAPSQKLWAKLCNTMNKPALIEDARFSQPPARAENVKEMIAEIEDWLKTFDNIDDAMKILEAEGIPCTKVMSTEEVVKCETNWERGNLVRLPTNDKIPGDYIISRGPHMMLTKTPPVLSQAPALGEHTQEILEHLGYGKEDVGRMMEKWG